MYDVLRVCLHLDALELEKHYLMTAVSGSFLFPATPNQQNRIFIRTRGIPEELLSYLENTWQGGWKCVMGVYHICQVPLDYPLRRWVTQKCVFPYSVVCITLDRDIPE